MPPIIRQNEKPLAFPDLRNLGAIVRILLGVNLAIAVGALVHAPRWEDWWIAWMDAVATAEPHLLFQMTLLVAFAPWLVLLSFRAGSALVLAVTAVMGIFTHWLLGLPLAPGALTQYLALALCVAGAMLVYFQLRAKALSPAVTEARLQALQARIRPHFLFNSINAVLSLVRAEPKRAETALEDMADLFRVLMSDNRELVPLEDEVGLCRQYLALEQLRLGERLCVEWHLKSMPADALVPPLVLQPIIENAVYHGVEPLSAAGVISINIFAKDGQVHAILRNPCAPDGTSHRAGNKMALGNVRERLALHFDAEAGLESRASGTTYEVHIRMPYRRAGRGAAAVPGHGRTAGAVADAADPAPPSPLRPGPHG